MKTIISSILLTFCTSIIYSQTEADKVVILSATNVIELNRLAPIYDSIFKAQKEEALKVDPPRVFIEQLKTKMNISKNRNDIEIFLNGTKMTQDIKIDVKK